MARSVKSLFAMLGAFALLVQAPLASTCVQACANFHSAAAQHSCCGDHAKKKPDTAKSQQCGKVCMAACGCPGHDGSNASASALIHVFSPVAVLPAELNFNVPGPMAESEIFLADSSPPPIREVSPYSLRAPPVLGA
ncbi:MAG TPA: hypothetical protein VNI20_08995 [Fimbriimonadaceae bacterium]|nr:hypothetical protein [Fimbriimonadaceae bacterium]